MIITIAIIVTIMMMTTKRFSTFSLEPYER